MCCRGQGGRGTEEDGSAALGFSSGVGEHSGPRYRTGRRFDGDVVRLCDVNTAETIEFNNSRQHNFIEDPSNTGQTLRRRLIRNTSREPLDGARWRLW